MPWQSPLSPPFMKDPDPPNETGRISSKESWASDSFIYSGIRRKIEHVGIIKTEIKKVTFFDLPY